MVFAKTKYPIENVLAMYAESFTILPAELIYDPNRLQQYQHIIENCNIYIIGEVPIVSVRNIQLIKNKLTIDVEVLKKNHTLNFPVPNGMKLVEETEVYFLENDNGERFCHDESVIYHKLMTEGCPLYFDVRYIGQAYGDDGARNALDRLLKHETLQKISLLRDSPDHKLTVLMLEINTNNQMITAFMPNAMVTGEEIIDKRISDGIDKLYNTSDKERVSLYEAALIRYFQPEYNKHFKDSFPSTNQKVLNDCYDKDLFAVSAEICFDNLMCLLKSDAVDMNAYHMAFFELHDDEERKTFFSFE